MTCEVDEREHEIAGLGRDIGLVTTIQRRFDLVGFLADLVEHRTGIVPVEPDRRGLLLQGHRARQRRLSGLDAREQA